MASFLAYTALAWSLVLLVLVKCVASKEAKEEGVNPQAVMLQECFKVDEPWAASEFRDYLADKTTRLQLHTIMWSKKAGAATGIIPSVTVYTVANPARLEALQSQCMAWSGPLAVGLYVPIDHVSGEQNFSPKAQETLNKHVEGLKRFFDRMEAIPDACALRLLLLYELVGEPVMHKLFPKCAVLNAALLAADTPLVAMLDVDLLPAKALTTDVLNNPTEAFNLVSTLQKEKAVVVLPAFEPIKQDLEDYLGNLHKKVHLALRVVNGSKEGLVEEIKKRTITLFDGVWHPEGHRATNLERWLDTNHMYPAEFEFQFEPWYLMERYSTVQYDLRYRGYGREKLAQLMHVNASGYKMLIHPTAFIVHRPHEFSPSMKMFGDALFNPHVQAIVNEKDAERAKAMLKLIVASGNPRNWGKVQFIKDAFTLNQELEELKQGTYRQLLASTTENCRKVLPWWKDGPRQLLPLRRLGQTA